MKQLDQLYSALRANVPVVLIRSTEEMRVLDLIKNACNKPAKKQTLLVWSLTSGIQQSIGGDGDEGSVAALRDHEKIKPQQTMSPNNALKAFADFDESAVLVMRDLHLNLLQQGEVRDPITIRAIKDVVYDSRERLKTVVITAPFAQLPVELQNSAVVIDFDLPDRKWMANALEAQYEHHSNMLKAIKGESLPVLEPETYADLSAVLAGLTEEQARNLIGRCLIQHQTYQRDYLMKGKAEILRAGSGLQLITPEQGIDDMGGLDGYKRWLRTRREILSDRAREMGIKPGGSLLAVGPPGTGKSLSSKILANYLGIPMIRFNMGQMMGKYVGESEGRLANALKVIESAAPCVLEVDEIEKGMASGGEDHVGRRMLGTFLTWFQELDKPVFINATANEPHLLAPELVNRFGDIMAFDLPNADERTDIWKIKLTAVNQDPTNYDIAKLVAATDDYTGRDIEKIVNNGLLKALAEAEPVSTDILLDCVPDVQPIARVEATKIESIRDWCKGKSIKATTSTQAQQAQTSATKTSGRVRAMSVN